MPNSRIRISILIMSVLGSLDALYLTWVKISNNQKLCIIGLGDCWSVNTSQYSELFGIPVALYGSVTYFLIFLISVVGSKNIRFTSLEPIVIFGISLFGSIYSIYLTYIEIAVIKSICPFCILSAVCMLLIFLLSIFRLTKIQTA
jgi:uncharacterized membrane protein